MKEKFKVYTITNSSWKEEAWITAVQRRNFHATLGTKGHWNDPDKGEYTDEYFGSLGHIVWREKIIEIGLGTQAEFAPLYVEDLSTLPPWDSKILGVTTEQKAIPPDTDKIRCRLLIKEAEYKDQEIYTATKFWNDNEYSFCGMVSKREVKKVETKSFGFGKAYWFFLDQLRPIEFTINGEKIVL